MYTFLPTILFSALITLIPYVQYAGYISPVSAIMPFLTVALTSLAAMLLLRKFFATLPRAAAMLPPLILAFYNSGALYEFVSSQVEDPKMKAAVLGVLFLLGMILFLAYVWKVRRVHETSVVRLTQFYVVLAAALLAFNLFSVIAQYRGYLHAKAHWDESGIRLQKGESALPDIYYVILDEYASPSQMKAKFKADQAPFVSYLKQKGFAVGELHSRSVATNIVIDARLNMTIAVSSGFAEVHSSFSESILESVNLREYRSEKQMFKIRENALVAALNGLGYQFTNIGSWFSYTRYNRHAKKNINTYGFQFTNEVSAIIANSSLLRFVFINRYFHRASVLDAFAALRAMPVGGPAPKFVFAHIICPHTPYVFGPNGEKVGVNTAATGKTPEQLYADQHAFITTKVKELVESKVGAGGPEPVIVVQADHGARMDRPGAHSIFTAIYVPGGKGLHIPEGIPASNTFRMLLNKLFAAKLEMNK